MNILIIHHCDSWGGAGVSLKDCCEMLSISHSVTVCVPHINSIVAKELKKKSNIKLVSLEDDMAMISAYNGGPSLLTRTFFLNLFKIHRCGRKISKLLSQNRYDLLLANSITLSWVCKIASYKKILACVYVRETKPSMHLGYFLQKWYIEKYADGVLFISEFDTDLMGFNVKYQTVVRDALKVKPDSIIQDKVACRNSFNLPVDKTLILFMGGMDKLKGYDYVVNAMKIIDNDDIVMVIAGNTNKHTRIERNNIIYVGLVTETSILYRACDILVFPSIEGHQARPVFESGFSKMPVIISDFPQTSYDVINAYNGLTVVPCDSQRLADAMILLSKNKALRYELGCNNEIMAKSRHDFYNCQKSLEEFIQTIAHN